MKFRPFTSFFYVRPETTVYFLYYQLWSLYVVNRHLYPCLRQHHHFFLMSSGAASNATAPPPPPTHIPERPRHLASLISLPIRVRTKVIAFFNCVCIEKKKKTFFSSLVQLFKTPSELILSYPQSTRLSCIKVYVLVHFGFIWTLAQNNEKNEKKCFYSRGLGKLMYINLLHHNHHSFLCLARP